jgi:ribosomal protein L7Ae-like RNA K-turn-binding protein
MKKLKIGYFPLSSDLSAPGDRRRLVFWAKSRGHTIILNEDKGVDVVFLSEKADLGAFARDKVSPPIILDLVDAYLAPVNSMEDLARGVSKYVSGDIAGFPRKFTRIVEKICERSSAVICSSPEQRELILPYSNNVHVILDSHAEFPTLPPRKPNKHESPHLLWEGMPATIRGISQVVEAISESKLKNLVDLEFVTDLSYFVFHGKYFERDTQSLISKLLKNSEVQSTLKPWSNKNLITAAQRASLGVIPINLEHPLQFFKPENRLLIMWRLGLPCLTSASPAYSRVSSLAGVDACCDSVSDWVEKIELINSSLEFAHENAILGQDYVKNFHNSDILLEKWDQAFASVA